jgi:hypothetical protein
VRPWRRALATVVLVAGAAGLVAIDRSSSANESAALGTVVQPVQPAAPTGDALTTAWFCPGVPADADGSASGTISVMNPADGPMTGTVTYTPSEGPPVSRPVAVPPRGRVVLEPSSVLHARFVAVQVEVFGTNAVVDQTTQSRAGTSVSPCASAASSTWYLADGTTTADAQLTMIVYNPFPDDAIVDFAFATDEGPRTPQALQGYVVPAHSIRLVDTDQTVRRSQQLSVALTARSGRVVLGRYQTFRSLRRGLVAGLAAPSAGTGWLFADGEKGQDVKESVVVFNPNPDDAEVDVTLFPFDPSASDPIEPISITVPGGSTQVVDVASAELVPDGRHSIKVSSQNDINVVAERVLDRGAVKPTSGAPTTASFGSLLTGGRWFLPSSPPTGSTYVLSIVNGTGQDTTAAVQVLGPAGPTPIAGLERLALAAAATVRVDLTGNPAAAQPIVVDAQAPVVVDRYIVPPGEGTGASASLAIVQG